MKTKNCLIVLIPLFLITGITTISANSYKNTLCDSTLIVTATTTPENCYYDCSGTINLEIFGGIPPFDFEWSNGSTEQNIDSLCPDIYYVTITDSTGCIDSTQVFVSYSDFEYDLIMSETPESYPGANDGTASVEVSGGNGGGYIEVWNTNPPQGGITAFGLSEGIYCVTVTDVGNGCSETNCIIVNTIYCGLNLEISDDNFTCIDSCIGSIDLTVTSGVPPFTYQWSDGYTSEDRSMLCINDYSVTVTDSTGCNYAIATTVEAYESMVLSFDVTPQGCAFSCDGSIDLSVEGGAPPYTYLWSNGATTEDIDSLCLAAYTVTVTDANGCVTSGYPWIEVPYELSIQDNVTGTSCGGACDGSIEINVLTGTGPYEYDWEDDSMDGLSHPTDLCSGVYMLTVTDANGCTGTTYSIYVDDITDVNPTFEVEKANCSASCNGSIDLTVENGTPPFTYLWSNGSTDEDLSDLCSGAYWVTITDSLGCEKRSVTSVGTIGGPVIDAFDLDGTCFESCDGSIDITLENAVEPIDYNWSDNSLDGIEDPVDLCEGFYDLTVTDALGCASSISIFINEPLEIIATVVTTDVSCFGECDGSADLEASGGVPPYSFDWPADMLCAGTYEATITDNSGCFTIQSFEIFEPAQIEITVDEIGPEINSQSNGFINVTVEGGTMSYSFNWILNGMIVSTDEDPTGLFAGIYILEIVDINGCFASSEEIVVDGIVGTMDHNLKSFIDIFPNPTKGLINIDFDLNEIENIEIEVFDFTGKKIIAFNEKNIDDQRLSIDLSNFSQGVYTLKININDTFLIERIVKQE